MRARYSILFIVIGYLYSTPLYAQELTPDSIYKRLESVTPVFDHTQLYLHADKSIYVHNENIWFTAYLLHSPYDLKSNHTLYVCLSNRATHKVVASEKFIMGNGLAAGYMFLPDSIPVGDYDLLAYTNTFIHEAAPRPFQQLVRIRAGSASQSVYSKTNVAQQPAPAIHFQWFPEGGDLIQGVKTLLAFEASADGQPVSVNGYLLENGTQLLPVQTNLTGQGKIEFVPVYGKIYSVALDYPANAVLQSSFPEIRSSGYSIHLEQGVTRDTAIVKIESIGAGRKAWLIMHNYRDAFHFVPLDISRGKVTVKLPIERIPAGLATITLLDSTTQPCAERAVFTGYDSLPVIQITADSGQYHTRSKVVLKIKAVDRKGAPLTASLSFASVLFKRVDTTSFQDIVPMSLYSNYVNAGLISNAYTYHLGTAQDIEMFLLTRCWTRYKKPRTDTSFISAAQNLSMTMGGQVYFKNKVLKSPVEISLVNGENISIFNTNETGHFELSPEMTEQRPDGRLAIFVNKKIKDDYHIDFKNDDDILNSKLARLSYTLPSQFKAALPEEVIVPFNNVKTLGAVVVSSRKKQEQETDFFAMTVYKSKTCNDYFCMYNIFNCRNHPTGGTPAMHGMTYTRPGGGTFRYECESYQPQQLQPAEIIFKLKGRYFTKQFYIADYAKFSPPEPEVLSTVLWMPQVVTDQNGEATVSFYTNDLPGIFSCIVEGVSTKGAVSGKKLIKVIQ
jgi:hypothetical protein